jgi:transmembrane sensor
MTPSLPPPEDASRLRQDVLEWFVRRNREEWRAADEREFQAWLVADARHREAYRQWESRWAALDAISPETVATWRSGFAGNQAAPTRRGFLKPAFAMAAAGMAVGGGFLGWRQLQAQPVFEQAFATRARAAARRALARRQPPAAGHGHAHRDSPVSRPPRGDAARRPGRVRGAVRERRAGTAAVRRAGRAAAGARGRHALRRALHAGHRGRRGGAGVGGGGQGACHAQGGRKDAENNAAKKGVFLTAGQQVESDALGALAAVSSVPGEGIAPWREHRLSFVDTPLSRALAELERYGNTGLVVKDPLVAALRLSGTFDPRDARTLRRALPSALPVRLKDAGAGCGDRARALASRQQDSPRARRRQKNL